jgi:hypothetical protein
MTQTAGMSVSLIRRLGGALAAALVLSVPALAVGALTTAAGTASVAIAAEDNAYAYGVSVAKAPAEQAAPPAPRTEGAGSTVLLQDWVYTGKPHPSPGH